MLEPCSFSSQRLRYRAWDSERDGDLMLRILQDPAAQFGLMGSVTRPMAMKDTKDFQRLLETCALAAVICLPAEDDSTTAGTPIGWCQLDRLEERPQHRCGHFGVIIDKAYRGSGYATEAVEWLLQRAFVGHCLNRVESNCWSWNTSALRVYEKVGFVVEGIRREAVWQEGGYRDDCMIAILAKDWFKRHPEEKRQ
ncbi:putative GNAT family acetyltransferase [Rhodotorula sp. JG-1b]|nr:putative GNAT family acetyltransferase [Rhodotorula sp. JG-1b]